MSVKLTRTQENRLWNLRQLIKAAGGTNAAAEKLARSPSFLTGIAGPKPQRTIGDRIATHIETVFGLPPGSLDNDPPKESKTDDPFLAQISATLAMCNDNDKAFVLAMSEWIAARSANALPIAGKHGSTSLAFSAVEIEATVNGDPNKARTLPVTPQKSTSTSRRKKTEA